MENARLQVIETAVQIESNISSLLAFLLKIDINKSKSLGSRNSTLSFNNKINLLLDMEVLSKEEAEKFMLFAQIRNQFAHNVIVNSYLSCMKQSPDLKNRLRKLYPDTIQSDLDIEASSFVLSLNWDMVSITEKIINKIKNEY